MLHHLPADLSVTEVAERYRILGQEESARPGLWRTQPYQKELMDAFSNPQYKSVTIITPTQMSKSEVLLNTILWIVLVSPGPTLLCQPSHKLKKDFANLRIGNIFKNCPEAKQRLIKSYSMAGHQVGNYAERKFRGGILYVASAQSSSDLSSRAVKYLLMDEMDVYPSATGNLGDPEKNLMSRVKSFEDHKIIQACVVTSKRNSRILKHYNKSNKTIPKVACPHCNRYFVMKRRFFKWTEKAGKATHIYLECRYCKGKIEEKKKSSLLASLKWITLRPRVANHAGFWINDFYNVFTDWKTILDDYLASKDVPSAYRTYLNQREAEAYVDGSVYDQPIEINDLYRRRSESYQMGELPKDYAVITAGADVQSDRVELAVWGWRSRRRCCFVERFVFWGNPATDSELWDRLHDVLYHKTYGSGTKQLKIAYMAIDSAYLSSHVYEFVRTRRNKVMAVKGRDRGAMIYSTAEDLSYANSGRITERKGVKVRQEKIFMLNVMDIKDILFSYLGLTDSEATGYIQFPKDITKELLESLLSEIKVESVNTKTGEVITYYKKIYRQNEMLDCFVYAYAAAERKGWIKMTEDRYDKMLKQGRVVKPAHTLETKDRPDPTGVVRSAVDEITGFPSDI